MRLFSGWFAAIIVVCLIQKTDPALATSAAADAARKSREVYLK
jgi:hypothetical protein